MRIGCGEKLPVLENFSPHRCLAGAEGVREWADVAGRLRAALSPTRARLALATSLVAAVLAAWAAHAPAQPLTLGISDQNSATFTDPRFAPLRLRHARFVTPWNAIWADPAGLDAWLGAARSAGVQPLVSFEHARGDRCPDRPCTAPSLIQFVEAFAAFRARYPWIHEYSPWNEANHETQPTWHHPDLAAYYFNIVRQACPHCRVVAADVLDEPNMARWLRGFVRYADRPRLWGLHNYRDTNRFRTSGTRTLLNTVRGQVWLTETGGITSFTTAKGVKALPFSETRAARSMRFLFDKVVALDRRRITRAYIYNWRSDPTNRFDAGLLRADGSARDVYWIVRRHATARPAVTPPRR